MVTRVEGTPTDVLVIRPADKATCLTHLYYVWPDGTAERLTEEPSGYGFTKARRIGEDTVVCGSRMEHSAFPDDAARRRIDRVDIECAIHRAGAWSAMTPMVVPDGEWAAWIRDVAEGESGEALVLWQRDMTFHPMDTQTRGRPPGDGLYQFSLVSTESSVVSGRVNALP